MRYAIALLFSLAASLAGAQDRLAELPAGASQLLVKGETYYYSGGSFYRPGGGGYLRVEPPLGARVPSAPGDSGSFSMDGRRYFVSPDGTFFRYDPQGGDYLVVNPPAGWRDYYAAAPELYSLPAPRQRPQAPPASRFAPPPVLSDPERRITGYYGRYRSDGNYGRLYGGYYGRYRFRDDAGYQSYRERQSACRRIARDQSRRANVGPYRREPGSYRDEYARCMR